MFLHRYKVKQILYRCGQALTISWGWGYQIYRQFASTAFTIQEILLVLISVRPQSHNSAGRIMAIKIPMTPPEIEPAIFRLIAQFLKHLRHYVPSCLHKVMYYTLIVLNTFILNREWFMKTREVSRSYKAWTRNTALTVIHSVGQTNFRSDSDTQC